MIRTSDDGVVMHRFNEHIVSVGDEIWRDVVLKCHTADVEFGNDYWANRHGIWPPANGEMQPCFILIFIEMSCLRWRESEIS